MWEKGDAGPLEPSDDREESRLCDETGPLPTDRGVSWPLGIHVSVCIRAASAHRRAGELAKPWPGPLCDGRSNKAASWAGFGAGGGGGGGGGMLAKVDNGEKAAAEPCDRSDWVDLGDDDWLLL